MRSPQPPTSARTPPLVRPVSRFRPWVVGGVFWASLAFLAWSPPRHSGNVWSRYMTIESIVERGTLAVERSPLLRISGSPDLIKRGRHFYSDKPPVLSAVGAAVAAPLRLAGLRMSRSPAEFQIVNGVLVGVLVGAGSCLSLVGLRRLLQTVPLPPLAADLLTLACGFGSLLLTYGVTFNNHSVAAGLLTYALAIVVLEQRRRFLAGLLAGLAATIDLPAGGALTLACALVLAVPSKRPPWLFLAGCVAPVVGHAVLQTAVSGSPLPVEMRPELFDYEGSYWTSAAGRWVEQVPRWQFGLELLLGPQGWLTVTPVLVLGLAGLAGVAVRRGDPLRPAALAVGGATLILVLYYTWGVRRTDFAGQSFGTRHLLAVTPAVCWFALVLLGRLSSRLGWAAFVVLWSLGFVYALAGMRDPWSRVENRDDGGLRYVKPLTLYPWSSYHR